MTGTPSHGMTAERLEGIRQAAKVGLTAQAVHDLIAHIDAQAAEIGRLTRERDFAAAQLAGKRRNPIHSYMAQNHKGVGGGVVISDEVSKPGLLSGWYEAENDERASGEDRERQERDDDAPAIKPPASWDEDAAEKMLAANIRALAAAIRAALTAPTTRNEPDPSQ